MRLAAWVLQLKDSDWRAIGRPFTNHDCRVRPERSESPVRVMFEPSVKSSMSVPATLRAAFSAAAFSAASTKASPRTSRRGQRPARIIQPMVWGKREDGAVACFATMFGGRGRIRPVREEWAETGRLRQWIFQGTPTLLVRDAV